MSTLGATIRDYSEDLETALTSVPDIRVYRDTGANLDPPGVVLGLPLLNWEGQCGYPTSARYLVYLVVPLDDRALERLWDLIPLVGRAIETLTNAAVISALPGVYTAGGSDLPAYELTVEVSL